MESYNPNEDEGNIAVIDAPDKASDFGSLSEQGKEDAHKKKSKRRVTPEEIEMLMIWLKQHQEAVRPLIAQLKEKKGLHFEEKKLSPEEQALYDKFEKIFSIVKKSGAVKEARRPVVQKIPEARRGVKGQEENKDEEQYKEERRKAIERFFDSFRKCVDEKFSPSLRKVIIFDSDRIKKIQAGVEAYRKTALNAQQSLVRTEALRDALKWATRHDIPFVGRDSDTGKDLRATIEGLDAKILFARRMKRQYQVPEKSPSYPDESLEAVDEEIDALLESLTAA